MKVTIISGSHRENSQSAKVGNYIKKQIEKTALFKNIYFLNLAFSDIPFWDEGVWNKDKKWEQIWNPIEKELKSSNAFIIISPEWGGMVPAKLKNFLLLCKSGITGHKPALIVSVSAGTGGSYPVNELRMSGYKNNKLCYIPDHVIVRHVEQVLNDHDKPESKSDERIRNRLNYTLEVLRKYTEAFDHLHSSDFDLHKFPNGM